MTALAYSRYRDWADSWLPRVPAHWSTGPLRHFATFETGWTPPTDDASSYGGQHLWANISDLSTPVIAATVKTLSDEAVQGRSPVPEGALLFSFKLSVGAVSRTAAPMYTNEAIAAFGESDSIDLAYAFYAFPVFVPMNANTNIYGAKLLNGALIRSAPIALPPKDEQRVIAEFLDHQTAKIDNLIKEQEQLVRLLMQRRVDLTRHVVLGDANPFDPPAGAPFTAIGHHFSVTLGKMLDAARARREGDVLLPYVRAANIQDSGLQLQDAKSMPYSAAEAATLDLRRGDLLVVEGGAVGTTALLAVDMPGWSFQKTVNRIRPTADWSTSWLGYVLRVYRDLGVIDIICNGSTIPHLTAEKLRSLRVPITQPDEQRRIAAYLDEQTAKIDRLIAETDRFIALSKERRAALITAAVTGQIDVREAA